MQVARRWSGLVTWRWPAILLLLLSVALPAAHAGGPRFVSGMEWGVPPGWNVVWPTGTLLYFTDPGPLSPTVSHSQADAMVAAAAAVWNAPTANISYAKGGELAEDVNTSNTYFDGEQLVFPADLQLSNERNLPVAIVYDTDGSLIDLLLGAGGSDPFGCGQNAVVGDIDDIHQSDGQIHHATLILNGRCVGSFPEQLTQMQYQLARAFGRVLGLSWSQTNDNVFTAQNTVTANQMAYWPLMHPIDTICGHYTYQCMTNPFTLRVDDLNSLAVLYPVYQSAVAQGKQGSSNDSLWLWGILYFPTGQGMDWVNIITHRLNNNVMEDWQTTSGITGASYSQAAATPLNSTPAVNSGSTTNGLDGYFTFRRVPLDGLSNVFFDSEAINPLYSGDYSLGPYVRPPVAPSGSSATYTAWSAYSTGDTLYSGFMGSSDAASSCDPGADGTDTSPAALAPGGWQNGLLCGWAHSSWWNAAVKAGHTWTIEVTATDETGSASVNKAQPVMGVWATTDPVGVAPTVASQPVPFNSMSLGMTQLVVDAADNDQSYRISVSDQFGAGRPDFTYVARVLYADTVTPATVGSGGGRIVITGTGFQQGNQVLINGVPARVLNWSSTQITADAPSLAESNAQVGVAVSVTVLDNSTGGSTTIPAGITYTQLPDRLVQVSVPTALETGIAGAVPFAVRVLASDGISPVANATVALAVTSGSAQMALCGTAVQCIVTTDSNGLVQTSVLGEASGLITLTATETAGGASVLASIPDTDPVRTASIAQPQHWAAAGASGTWTVQVTALQDNAVAAGAPVTWTLDSGLSAGATDQTTGRNGVAQLIVSASNILPGSASVIRGCVWTTVCASWTVYGVDASQWVVTAPGGVTQTISRDSALNPVQLATTDLAGHPLEFAPVQVSQRVLAWEGACTGGNPCPSAPVLSTLQASTNSDAEGTFAITPLRVAGVPQVLEVAVSTGSQGFVALTFSETP